MSNELESIYSVISNIYYGANVLCEDNTSGGNIGASYDKDELAMNITKGKMKLYNIAPYLGRIISEVNIRVVSPNDPNVSTMAVDNFGNMYINPSWSTKLSGDEFLGVFAHEMLHIANGTHLRMGARKKMFGGYSVWNIATDAVMNYALSNSGFTLPKDAVIPDPDTGVYEFKDASGKSIGQIKVTNNSNNPVSAEEVYNQLIQLIDKLNEEQKNSVLSKDGTTDKHLTPEETRSSAVASREIEDLTPEQLEELEQKRQSDIEMSDDEPKQSSNKGGSIRKLITTSIPVKINWRGIINKYLKALDRQVHNWMVPNKRAYATGYYAPSRKSTPNKLSALVAIDTSGSITDKQFKIFIDGISSMISSVKKVNLYITLWHTEAYLTIGPIKSVSDFNKAYSSIKPQSGGTIISCCNPIINELNASLVIFFTDGELGNNVNYLPKKGDKLFIILNRGALSETDISNIQKKGKAVIIPPSTFN